MVVFIIYSLFSKWVFKTKGGTYFMFPLARKVWDLILKGIRVIWKFLKWLFQVLIYDRRDW
ncbi:MAG: hypothetical protein COB85_09660 [Bacteroidetes bacterium]|nr:MAG: hypothetical protein COB85_09660 [Bacteroidota bacterium]